MLDPDPTPSRLLQRVREGDRDARGDLLARLYSELHLIAERLMDGERVGHTLQPTALVNEAWIRLFAGEEVVPAENRAEFLRIAARAMRNVLIDHARRRDAVKRPGRSRVEPGFLDLVLGHFEAQALDVLEVDEALLELESVDAKLARIVELRFFAGLTVPEVARTLGASTSGIERGWRLARAWLRRRLPPRDGSKA